MPDTIKDVVPALPFMLPAASALSKEGGQVVNRTRIVEAVIIAVIIGVLSVGGMWFMLIPVLKTELRYVARDVRELQATSKGVQVELKQLQIAVFTRADYAAHLSREHRPGAIAPDR